VDGVAAGLALGLAAAAALDRASEPAAAQEDAEAAGFTLSVGQLRINQRISQAAVRRSNHSLALLSPLLPEPRSEPNKVLGWRAEHIRDGAVNELKLADGAVATGKLKDAAVTEAKLAPTAAARLPMWAVVQSGTATLVRDQGAASASKLPDAGLYRVLFDREVAGCAYQATIGGQGTDVAPAGQAAVWTDPEDPKAVVVRTADQDGLDVDTLPFHLTVTC
jgi:hypothetical protein